MSVSSRRADGMREDTTGTIMCNACGAPAPVHLFRPSIGYRCSPCVVTWGKIPLTSVRGEDGIVRILGESEDGINRGVMD